MALTTTEYGSILKTHYMGPMVDQLENSSAFLGRTEKMEVTTGGNFLYIPVRTGRTTSIGARTDSASENLPAGASPVYNKATYVTKSLYATMQISGKVMRVSKNDAEAFARADSRDMEDTTKDLKKDVNRQLFGDGSAELCQISASTSTTTTNTVTVTSNLYPSNPARFLEAGLTIDARNWNTGVVHAGGDSAPIVSVNKSAGTFIIDSATSITVSDHAIYREDNLGTGGPPKEINGLWGIIDNDDPEDMWGGDARLTEDIGGLDRDTAANAFWQGQVRGNSGTDRPFSLMEIQAGIDDSEINAGGEITLLQTNHPIYRQYGGMLAAAKTIDMMKMKLDGGWDALSVNGIPMVRDVECPDNVVFCIDESTFKLAVTGPWNWLTDGGDVLSRIIGKDQYEAVLQRDCQLICDKPAANVKIEDISHGS